MQWLHQCHHYPALEQGSVPVVDGIGGEPNHGPHKVSLTGGQYIDDVLTHDLTVLFSKTLYAVGDFPCVVHNRKCRICRLDLWRLIVRVGFVLAVKFVEK